MKQIIEANNLLHVKTRKQWRDWLRINFKKKSEIWLVYSKKQSNETRILYNDAVEEALCFGWIDSTVRTIDENRYAQRFSPRKINSPYSQANIERMNELIKRRKVIEAVIDSFNRIAPKKFSITTDIISAIKRNKEAFKYYQKFPKSYIRIRIAFIEGARNRPAEFNKRLNYFIEMTSKNKQFGFGGIEKYYKKK
jgi:uncharacterized protein YdeI (YjbR/CyaY-like superfamily)